MVPSGTPNLLLFLTALAAACFFDIFVRRVPNWLSVGLLCAGLGARLAEYGWQAAGLGLLGALAGLVVLFYPFHRRWVAGGDVKVLMAMGAWLGPKWLLLALLVASAAGGVLSLFYLLRSGSEQRREILTNLRLTVYLRNIPDIGSRSKRESPPYTLALAAGAVTILLLQRGIIDLGLKGL